MVKVVLVDDHLVVREGMKILLACDKEIQVVGEADGPAELLRLYDQSFNCDVILLDFFLKGGCTALTVLPSVYTLPRCPRILMVSLCTDPVLVQECLRLGAHGFLAKVDVAQHLCQAIHLLMHENTYISPSLCSRAVNPIADDEEPLTMDELLALDLLGQGCSTKKLSNVLHLRPDEVACLVSQLQLKLCCADRQALLDFTSKRNSLLKDQTSYKCI